MTLSKLLPLLLVAACTSSQSPVEPGPDSGSDRPAPIEGTTCAEILDCITACEDDACADVCLDDGSPQAQDQILDLSACITDNHCTDSACVESSCGDLLEACYGDWGGDDPDEPHGSPLPASLVGEWNNGGGQVAITYQFTSDGHVSNVAGLYTGSGSCDSSYVYQYDGLVQLAADTITLTPTTGSFTIYGCDGTTPTSQGSHTDPERFRFATGSDAEGPFLILTNLDSGNAVTYHRL